MSAVVPPESVLLFATVGRTDLRVLAKDEKGQLWRVAVNLHVRAFHQYLLDHADALDIRDEGEGKPREDATFDPESPRSIARAVQRLLGLGNQCVPILDQQSFVNQLFTARQEVGSRSKAFVRERV